jgi:hypothetical protein
MSCNRYCQHFQVVLCASHKLSYLEFEQSAFPYCATLARNATVPYHQVNCTIRLTDWSSVESVWVIFTPLATLLRESILTE